MVSIDELANTLCGVAVSGMKPKALLAAVRERHPEATKKEVVRTAFYALAEGQGCGVRVVESFASTLLQDGADVCAGLRLPCSRDRPRGSHRAQAPLSHHVRPAKLDLLRRRFLLAA